MNRSDAHTVAEMLVNTVRHGVRVGMSKREAINLCLTMLATEWDSCKMCFIGEAVAVMNENKTLPGICEQDENVPMPTHTCHTKQ